MRYAQRLLDSITRQIPRDFIDVIERGRLDVDRGEVENLAHALEWVKAEPKRFPRDFSRRGVLAMGLMIPAASVLFWPRPVYAAGYNGVYPTIPVITGPTYYVSNYVTSPTTPGSTTTQLQTALNDVTTTGGTLVFSAGVTYHINGTLTLTGGTTSATAKQNFRLDGKGATIFGANSWAHASMLSWRRCKNFIVQDLTFDGNRANRPAPAETSNHNILLLEANSNAIGGGNAAFINVTSKNCPASDGFVIRGESSSSTAPSDPNRHSRNIVFFKCSASGNARMGFTINNAHNSLFLGIAAFNHITIVPQSGLDFEPNGAPVGGGPSISNILVRGGNFSGNGGKGVHISGGEVGTGGPGPVHDSTVEGCYFTDGASAPDPNSQGSAVHIIAIRALVQQNLIENFTRTNQAAMIAMSGAPTSDCVVDGNHFNNIQTGDAVLRTLGTTTGGATNVFSNNRAFNHSGALEQNGSGATFTGNQTVGSPTFPAIVPPVPSFVGQDCLP